MKIYFVKYLPVGGEIKVGDYFIVNNTNPIKCIMEDFPQNTKETKKVKLFLCSRDIQIGDKARFFLEPKKEVIIGERWDYEDMGLFKVIGEISLDAIWIKEGDEFDKVEIQFHFKHRSFKDEDLFYIGDEYNDAIKEIEEQGNSDKYTCVVEVLCPICKTFH